MPRCDQEPEDVVDAALVYDREVMATAGEMRRKAFVEDESFGHLVKPMHVVVSTFSSEDFDVLAGIHGTCYPKVNLSSA